MTRSTRNRNIAAGDPEGLRRRAAKEARNEREAIITLPPPPMPHTGRHFHVSGKGHRVGLLRRAWRAFWRAVDKRRSRSRA